MIAFFVQLRDTTRNIAKTSTQMIMDGVAGQMCLTNLTPNVSQLLDNVVTNPMDIPSLNIYNVLTLILNAAISKKYKSIIHSQFN